MFLPFLQHLTYDFKLGSRCHAFLQERIQNAVQWSEKSHLERARPKNVPPFTLAKSGGGV